MIGWQKRNIMHVETEVFELFTAPIACCMLPLLMITTYYGHDHDDDDDR